MDLSTIAISLRKVFRANRRSLHLSLISDYQEMNQNYQLFDYVTDKEK